MRWKKMNWHELDYKKKLMMAISVVVVILVIVGVIIFARPSEKKQTPAKKESVKEVIIDLPKQDEADIEEVQPSEPIQQEPQQETQPKPQEEPSQKKEPVQPVAPVQPETPKIEAIPGQHRNPNRIVVVIDPGHQLKGDAVKEPNGPGSKVMKARVTGGTTGAFTGVSEYVLNLDIGLKLKTELENRGYTVYMTRNDHNINLSNMERARYASNVGADIAVRLHANGASSSSVHGAETLTPSSKNPYISHLAKASQQLSECVLNSYCKATGFANRGVKAYDTMTGMNWSEVPVTILEMGFMSNESDDRAMQDAAMQNNMVQGIANGIDAYFGL